MPEVVCPACQKRGNIPASRVGASIRCRDCATQFDAVPVADGTAAQPLAQPQFDLPSDPQQVVVATSGFHRIAWLLCFVWNAVCFAVFLIVLLSSRNSLQESSAAAIACAAILAGYVGTRALTEAAHN